MRAFFAIPISKPVETRLIQTMEGLKPLRGFEKISWSRPENFHITLQFFPDLQMTEVSALCQRITHAIQATTPFEVVIETPSLFPSRERPQVISMCIAENAALQDVVARLRKATFMAGYSVESRPFKPHLTLGRIRSKYAPRLPQEKQKVAASFIAKEVVFYKSDKDANGTIYQPLQRIVFR